MKFKLTDFSRGKALIKDLRKTKDLTISLEGISALSIGSIEDLIKYSKECRNFEVVDIAPFIRRQILEGTDESTMELKKILKLRKTKKDREYEEYLFGDCEGDLAVDSEVEEDNTESTLEEHTSNSDKPNDEVVEEVAEKNDETVKEVENKEVQSENKPSEKNNSSESEDTARQLSFF